MNRYSQEFEDIAAGGLNLAAERARDALRQAWPKGDEYNANLQSAYRAMRAFAMDPEELEQLQFVNHPVIWKIFSRIGRELSEGGGMDPAEVIQSGVTLESLYAHPAYKAALKSGVHTPESQRITTQISALMSANFPGEQRPGGLPFVR